MATSSMFCLKLPWVSDQSSRSSAPCTFEVPFFLKSVQTLQSLLSHLVEQASQKLPRADRSSVPSQSRLNIKEKLLKKSALHSPKEQAEFEQRALASALSSGKEATLIEFYSPKCRLCNSLLDLVEELESRNADWVSIVMADVELQNWLPEILHYGINYVPCFVLLDKHGRALAKTDVPKSRLHVIAGLSHIFQLKCPKKQQQNT